MQWRVVQPKPPGGRDALNKVLYGEAPSRVPTPLPFYIPFLTEKVPLSRTYLRTLHPFSKPLEGSLLVAFM